MMGKNEQTVGVDWCCSCFLVVSTVTTYCPPLVEVLFLCFPCCHDMDKGCCWLNSINAIIICHAEIRIGFDTVPTAS